MESKPFKEVVCGVFFHLKVFSQREYDLITSAGQLSLDIYHFNWEISLFPSKKDREKGKEGGFIEFLGHTEPRRSAFFTL